MVLGWYLMPRFSQTQAEFYAAHTIFFYFRMLKKPFKLKIQNQCDHCRSKEPKTDLKDSDENYILSKFI